MREHWVGPILNLIWGLKVRSPVYFLDRDQLPVIFLGFGGHSWDVVEGKSPPTSIWNIDEKRFHYWLVGHVGVMVKAGRKNPLFRMYGGKELESCMETVNATGAHLRSDTGGRYLGWHSGVNSKEDKEVPPAWASNG